jgi:hypothetical protein
MALTLSYDPGLSRIQLALTGAGGTAVTALFDRSADGGVTYTTIRGASAVAIAGTNANANDYEFPVGRVITYRVRTYTAGGALVDTFTATTSQNLDQAWLKVPAAPYLNQPVTVVDRSEVTRRSRSALFDVVGRSFPVMVGDVASSVSYTLELLTEDVAARISLDYLFASGEVVFLHLPVLVEDLIGGYFAVGDVSNEPPLRLSKRRVWRVPLTQVAAPGPEVIGPAYTWASVLADYATWSGVLADPPTWSLLLQRVGSPSDVIVP